MFLSGRRAFRRGALLATLPVAAVLGAGLLLPSSAAACPSDGVCTNSSGEYTLTVPPLSGPVYGPYASCEWDVHVDFHDGTTADYVFNGEVGISKTHTFLPYGRFRVEIKLSNGHRTDASTEECPNVPLSATVYHQSPQEIAEEEQRVKEEKEAKEKKEQEEKTAKEAKKQKEQEEREARERAAQEKFGGGTGGSGSEGSSGGGGQTGPAYWQTCRGRIQVHGVGCAKARKVVGRARRKNLFEEGPQEILGFTCHLTGTRPAQISCRHGKRRILAPL